MEDTLEKILALGTTGEEVILIQSHLRATDLFVPRDRECKNGRESQGNNTCRGNF